MFRLNRGKRIVPIVALAASLTLLAACGSTTPDTPGASGTTSTETDAPTGDAPAETETLRIWSGNALPIVANFNPYAPGTALHATNGAIYQPLFHFNKVGPEAPGSLVGESYEFSEDGKEATLKLRTGIKWNDGTDLTADDVVYSFTNSGAKASYLENAEKVDETTVKLTFNTPAFTNELALFGMTLIVPEKVFGEYDGEALTQFTNETDPIGSGPYKLSKFSSESYTIVPNENYWDESKPAVTAVQYIGIDGNTTAEALLQTGQVDWASMFVPDPESITGNGEYGYVNTPVDPTTIYTCASVSKGCEGPQTDVAVRQALNLAIDRGEIDKRAFASQTAPISPTFALLGRDDAWIADGMPKESPQTADAAAAGKILEEAGYTKGGDGIYEKDGKKLTMELVSPVGWTDYNDTNDLIQQQALAAGIDVKASQVSQEEWGDMRFTGQFELLLGGITGTSLADPYQLYKDWFAGDSSTDVGTTLEPGTFGFSRYDNADVDAAITAAAQTNDEAEKKAQYAIVQENIVEELPYIPVVINATQTFFNVAKFDNWPSEDNLYAYPPAWGGAGSGMVLSTVTGK